MKTLVVAIALMMVGSAATFAMGVQESDSIQTEVIAPEEGTYKEVVLADLNENVQATINSLSEASPVKSLEYNADKKLTKVTLVAKEGENESVVILDDEGKKVE